MSLTKHLIEFDNVDGATAVDFFNPDGLPELPSGADYREVAKMRKEVLLTNVENLPLDRVSRDPMLGEGADRLIGTSRRTAVPLMELFDAEHLTIRSGDVRKLRAPR